MVMLLGIGYSLFTFVSPWLSGFPGTPVLLSGLFWLSGIALAFFWIIFPSLQRQFRDREKLRRQGQPDEVGETAQATWHRLTSSAQELYRSRAYGEARDAFRLALERAGRLDQPEILVTSLKNLALVCEKLGERAESDKLYERARLIEEEGVSTDRRPVAGRDGAR